MAHPQGRVFPFTMLFLKAIRLANKGTFFEKNVIFESGCPQLRFFVNFTMIIILTTNPTPIALKTGPRVSQSKLSLGLCLPVGSHF